MNSEEKKRGFILSEGEVNRIEISFFPWADISSPDDRFSYRNAEVSLSE
jgi:hypothetical protein